MLGFELSPSLGLAALAILSSTSTGTADHGLYAVVSRTSEARSRAILRQLEAELGRALRSSTTAEEAIGDLVAVAQTSSVADVVVVLPADLSAVGVVRPRDRTVLVRSFESADARASPYALAIATAELVRLLETRPLGVEATTTRPSRRRMSLRFAGGVSLFGSSGDEQLLFQPEADVGVELDGFLPADPIAAGVLLSIRLPGSRSRDIGERHLGYRRVGLSLRLAGLYRTTILTPLAMVGFDLSQTHISLEETGRTISSQSRIVFAIDGVLGVRVELGAGFSIDLVGGLAYAVNPADFLLDGEDAVSEGRLRPFGRLAIGWSTRTPEDRHEKPSNLRADRDE